MRVYLESCNKCYIDWSGNVDFDETSFEGFEMKLITVVVSFGDAEVR